VAQSLNVPVAAGGGRDDLGRAAAPEGPAGDPEGRDGRAELAVVRIADGPLDHERLGGVGEQAVRRPKNLQGAGLVPAVPAVMGGMADGDVCPVQRVQGSEQGWLIVLDREGDRLRRFRARLPCEVVVTAVTHPLHGCRLRAYAVRHVDGVPHLKVELPDGMPGLVAVEATDALGAELGGAGAGLVLDGDGLRRLRAVVMRLRDGDASGPGR
jgi:hypothetical protein